jgi:hypothetical protein
VTFVNGAGLFSDFLRFSRGTLLQNPGFFVDFTIGQNCPQNTQILQKRKHDPVNRGKDNAFEV